MELLYLIFINIQFVFVKTQFSAEETQMVVTVPDGFNPPVPPLRPWLYPFENAYNTHTTNSYIDNTDDTDWHPITPTSALAPTGTAIKQYVPYDSENLKRHHNHRYDPIGPWQPLFTDQLPIKPQPTEKSKFEKMNDTHILIGGHLSTTKVKDQNTKKIINLKVMEQNQTLMNFSATTPLNAELYTTLATTEDVWPANIEHRSNARQDTVDEESEEYFTNENEDLQANIPINITKLGLPFENNNSTDNASICVPLTIQINHPGKNAEEVERIYCFPLPAKQNNTQSNITSTNDIANIYNSSNFKVKFNHNYMLMTLLTIILLRS